VPGAAPEGRGAVAYRKASLLAKIGRQMSSFVYAITRIVLTTPLTFMYRFEVTGGDNWPRHGPAIIASNHASNADPCLVGIAFPGQIRWMAKAELWKIPLLGWLISKLGAFPVHRGESDRQAIRRARELLGQGWIVGMFPEGTRQRGGTLGEPQAGVGLLALEPDVPVVPVRIRGNELIIRGKRPHRPKITVNVGEPVDMDIKGMSRGRAAHEASRRIMAAIEAL
jgi:1-acyl-sn-glycerol-3-phosphate acyltransferase